MRNKAFRWKIIFFCILCKVVIGTTVSRDGEDRDGGDRDGGDRDDGDRDD